MHLQRAIPVAFEHVRCAMLVVACLVASSLHLVLAAALEIDVPAYRNILPKYAAAWLPCLALAIWFNAIHDGRGRFLLTLDPLVLWLAAIVATVGMLEIGLATATDKLANGDLVFDFFWIGVLYLVLLSFRSLPNGYDLLLRSYVACALLIAVLYLVVPQHGMLRVGIREFFVSPYRPLLDNPNALAYGVALASLLSFARVLSVPSASERWVWGVFWLSNAAGVVSMKSRGAWLALIAGTVLLLLFATTRRCHLGLLFLIVATAMAGVASMLPGSTLDSWLSLGRGLIPAQELLIRGETDLTMTSVVIRLEMVKMSIDILLQHPFLGIGLEALHDNRVAGHTLHGLLFIIAAAYGLVGVALMAGLPVLLLRALPLAASPKEYWLCMLVLLFATLTLQGIPYWYAIAMGLMALNRVGNGREARV